MHAMTMKSYARIAYVSVLVIALGVFLFYRRVDILAGSSSTVDTLVAGAFLALLLLPVFREVTLGGVTLKSRIEAIVQHEVGRVQLDALNRVARLDLQMMPIWEREHSSVQSDFMAKKLALFEENVSELERLWASASFDDKAHYGLALRILYWEWLEAARNFWASSAPYHDVWRRVEKGFAELGNIPHIPSR